MTQDLLAEYVRRFAEAPSLDRLPSVVDVLRTVPVNPPEEVQTKFVGYSYTDAYTEAASFVRVVADFAQKHGPGALGDLGCVIDFGSGWGRISRTLLTMVPPEKLVALDVDAAMTALVNTSLPGVNAMTIAPNPPTLLRDRSVDAVLAFSVFSHLSGAAQAAWAQEFGRLVRVGGMVAITVLDERFFDKVATGQEAVRAGNPDFFATALAETFPDLEAARAGYAAGEVQFAGVGGEGVRTGDYYGWTASPPQYVGQVWGAAGFEIVEWVPSDVLFEQALVYLVRRPDPTPTTGFVRRLRAAIARQRSSG